MSDDAVYALSQIACAMIEAMGMQAENQYRQRRDSSPAFMKEHFDELIDKYGIHHNAILGTLRNNP